MNCITPAKQARVIAALVEGNSIRATVRMNRIQLTTDGHRAYLEAVGSQIDYAMLVKLYGNDRESEARYSPAECIGCRAISITGNPKTRDVSTSYVERQNLTMRMQNAPIHAPHKRFLKEDSKPWMGNSSALHALQLLPRAPDFARHSCDGSWDCRSCLDY